MLAIQATTPAPAPQYYAGPFDLPRPGQQADMGRFLGAQPVSHAGPGLSPRLVRLALAQRQHHQGRL